MSGVDLERLISESKERLGKHKEYLEKTAQRGSGSSNVDAPMISPPRTYSPSRFAATSPPEPTSGAAGGGNVYNRGTNRNAPHNTQQPRHLSPAQYQQPQRGDSPTYSGFQPYSSNVARAGHNNYGDGNDYSGYQHDGLSPTSSARRRGHYTTGRPLTKVYDRGQKFVETRESFLSKQRQESWHKEMEQCTFSPFVSKKAAKTQGRTQHGKSPSPTNNNNTSSSSNNNANNSKNLLDWCVESDRSNVGFHVDAPSVFLHIQRQQDARKAKADGEAKLTIDTTHWRPTVTKPNEFNFGRSDQPIRALRKPMLQMVRLDSAGNERAASGSRSPARRTPRTASGGGGASKSPNRNNNNNADDDDDDRKAAAERKRLAELSSVASEQKQQIDQQSEEISRLNGMIQSLKMESEAAKAKVREMALSQTIATSK